MGIFGIDIDQIADLDTHVATCGAIRAGETAGDDVFEYIVGIAIVIHQTH